MKKHDRLRPLYRLIMKTPRIELRLPTEQEIHTLGSVVSRGIGRPGEPMYHEAWLYESSPKVEQKLMEHVEKNLAEWTPENWTLGLVAFVNGQPIGMQHIFSKNFGKTRCFGSGAWLGLDYQGKGFGTEMGRAILKLGFDGLGAREAYIGAWADNAASIRVMEKLGYIPNGQYYQLRGDEVQLDKRMRYPKENWDSTKHKDVLIEGLEDDLLELFGVRSEKR
jgi:RimJ/RimL family protein N-acetyltransferase